MNEDIDRKLDRLLAELPKPQHDLDAWLSEDKTAAFDRVVSQRRRRTMWRWAAAACLLIIIGVGATIWPREDPAQPIPSLVGEGLGVGSVTKPTETAHIEKTLTPPPAPPLQGRGEATGRRPTVGNEVAHRKAPRNAAVRRAKVIPDTLGDGIWRNRENVVLALQMLSECEQTIRREEQEVRNTVIKATFRAMPQPANVILVTTETGDCEVMETKNIIEI